MKTTKRKQVKNNILAEGEATGHAHCVDVPVFEGVGGVREFDGATTIIQEEHAPIVLPDREWASSQVVEYDYLKKMVRKVVD